MAYEIETDFQVPEVSKTRKAKESKYSFHLLENKQAFFVPDSDVESGNAATTLKHSIFTAQKKASTATGNTKIRFFVVEASKEVNGELVKGAKAYRNDNQ